MASKGFLALYDEFRSVMAAGNEAAARQFLIQHRSEFPQEIQDHIALFFLSEGVRETAEQAAGEHAAREEVAGNINTLEQAKRALEDKLKVLDLTEQVQKKED